MNTGNATALFIRGLVILGLVILGSGLIMPALARHTESQHVNRVTAAWPVDAFTLTDQRGKPFTERQLLGRWTFILLGDTGCGEPCKAPLAALTGMYQRIARTEAMKTTQVLFISVAAERETPASLQQYLAPFDKAFVGATGPSAVVSRLVDDLGAADRLPPQPANGRAPDYSGSLLLIGPDGMTRAEFLPPFDVLLLTAEYFRNRVRG